MELLLILSALLTGLTGAFTGDRPDVRPQVQTTGVEAAPSADGEALMEAATALLQENAPRLSDLVDEPPAASWALLPSPVAAIVGASERRLE